MDNSGKEDGRAITQCQKQTKPLPLLSPLVTSSYKRCLVFLSPYAEVGEHTCSLNRISSFTLELPYSSEKKFFGKQSSKKDGLDV